MTQPDERDPQSSIQDVALIVGGGPGISSSCARLFAKNGMRVGIAARNPDKTVLLNLEQTHGVRRYECDASEQPGRSRRTTGLQDRMSSHTARGLETQPTDNRENQTTAGLIRAPQPRPHSVGARTDDRARRSTGCDAYGPPQSLQ